MNTDRDLRGASRETVRRAIETGDPFPGTAGFAGKIDGTLVRDVLGRVPLFVDAAVEDPRTAWSFSPGFLDDPKPLPSGSVLEPGPTEPQKRWRLPEPNPTRSTEAALDRLQSAIGASTDRLRHEPQSIAIAFSGGVDSALVAGMLDAPCYVVGFPDSHDVEAARSAAEAMGIDLSVVELDLDTLEATVPVVARAIGRTNPMDVAIALPLYLVARRASVDGFDAVALGQGADELFGGYEKVVHLDHRVDSTTVSGAVREQIETLPEQLPRDVLAIEAGGVDPVTPLLHDAVIEAALRLPARLLADEDRRKRGFRRVASEHVPETVAFREKKAVQYGTNVSRELDRLARRAGFKRRMDDHVGQYVRSRIGEEA